MKWTKCPSVTRPRRFFYRAAPFTVVQSFLCDLWMVQWEGKSIGGFETPELAKECAEQQNRQKSLAETRAELRLLRDPSTRDTTARQFKLGSHLVDSYIATLEAQERRLVREMGGAK